jgi:hypothetical protein
MRKALGIVCLLCLPMMAGCALSDIFFNLFGDAYSAGDSSAGRRMDYDDRVNAMNAPPAIPGASASPFTP